MASSMLNAIKLTLRIKHDALDEDIQADITACLADLEVCGVVHAPTGDPLILNAVKLYCRAMYTDDVVKSAEYLKRYEALKACLMMADGYGREASNE